MNGNYCSHSCIGLDHEHGSRNDAQNYLADDASTSEAMPKQLLPGNKQFHNDDPLEGFDAAGFKLGRASILCL